MDENNLLKILTVFQKTLKTVLIRPHKQSNTNSSKYTAASLNFFIVVFIRLTNTEHVKMPS